MDTPPRNTPPQIKGPPAAPKPVRPLTQTHVIIGVVAGLVVGFALATLIAVSAGLVLFTRVNKGPNSQRIQGFQPPLPMPQPPQPPEPAQDRPAPSDAEERALLAEIDAAAQLSFENDILGQFMQIAGRSNLAPSGQVHLVEMTFKRLAFGHNQVQVLLKLINNPQFAPEGKERILKDLNKIAFDHEKKSVLDAMNKRGVQK